jgi:hypothetical protein
VFELPKDVDYGLPLFYLAMGRGHASRLYEAKALKKLWTMISDVRRRAPLLRGSSADESYFVCLLGFACWNGTRATIGSISSYRLPCGGGATQSALFVA